MSNEIIFLSEEDFLKETNSKDCLLDVTNAMIDSISRILEINESEIITKDKYNMVKEHAKNIVEIVKSYYTQGEVK